MASLTNVTNELTNESLTAKTVELNTAKAELEKAELALREAVEAVKKAEMDIESAKEIVTAKQKALDEEVAEAERARSAKEDFVSSLCPYGTPHGAPLPGSGEHDFRNLENAIAHGIKLGHKPVIDFKFIEIIEDKVWFYREGEQMYPNGDMFQIVTIATERMRMAQEDYLRVPASGEKHGISLAGSGVHAVNNIEEAVAHGLKLGYTPETTYEYVDIVDGMAWFYAKGNDNGCGGKNLCRVVKKAFIWKQKSGSDCGKQLPGCSGENSFNNVKDAIVHATKCGYIPGVDLCKVQLVSGKWYFYGPGSASGKGGDNVYQVFRTDFKVAHTPGEILGKIFRVGDGYESTAAAVADSMKLGNKPGVDYKYVQMVDRKAYFYLPGTESGRGGQSVYRIDEITDKSDIDPGCTVS